MPACATDKKVGNFGTIGNLFLPVPDTDFRDFLEEVETLARVAPEIIVAIERDLDKYAREKKQLRQADKKFFESRTGDLPSLDIQERTVLSEELDLAIGRPRMPGYAVYVFLMMRGFFGSLTSKQVRRFLRELMSLHDFLRRRGLSLPGVTTILENVNLVSSATRSLIFDKQINSVIKEDLDDFKSLTIDSTAVKANSSWPTDAKILTGLLLRANRLGQKLDLFGLDKFRQGWVPRWLEEMDKLSFQICLVAGKAKSRGKLKRDYRLLLRRGLKAAGALAVEFKKLEESRPLEKQVPSRRVFLERILQQIRTDLADAVRVHEYATNRVFHEQALPSTKKVLSLSDGSAAYIQKGSRNPVIGYKPQLVRSQKGFVTHLVVPHGNTSDATELSPAIAASILRTGIVAEWVSTDDGYASAKGRDEVLGLGVNDISISGAKGKKLTDPEDWESDEYRNVRRLRSAVESLMFTIKNGFEFGELGRRGLAAVRDELLEKVLAYNCCRIILIRKRKREEFEKVA